MPVSRRCMRWLAVSVALPASLVVGLHSAQRTFSGEDARPDELRLMASSHRSADPPRAVSEPLVFGVYPGGAAGAVGPAGQTRPEVPEARRDALRRLRGGVRPFVLRLYESYTRRSDAAAVPPWLASLISAYSADGFRVELVLAYRPADRSGDVAGFTDFVRARVRQLAGDPGVAVLQWTNEATSPERRTRRTAPPPAPVTRSCVA